ncbi:MAG: transglutaminase family protein [Candidatus Aenigmatarchaeota archaeon]
MVSDKFISSFTIFILLTSIILPNISSGYQLDPQKIEHLEGSLKFEGQIYSPLKIDELNYSYYGIPEKYYELETPSKYTVEEDHYGNKKLTLNYEDVMEKRINVEIKFESDSKFGFPKNIDYPYDPPKNVVRYLEPGNKTLSSESIKKISQRITEGSTNSFEVVSRLTRWINTNLVYDESYGNVAKNADWILENKRGTCDEFSTLLISMLRSTGIPSRYVAGAVYSKKGWGYHGWVEVYLDKWVPIDPTWNEVGWIDATHIPFGRFKDPDEVDVGIEYKSFRNIGNSIRFKAPDVEVDIKREMDGNKILDLETSSYPDKIAPGKSSVIKIAFEKEEEGCVYTKIHVIPRLMENGKPTFEEKKIPIDICDKYEEEYFVVSPENLRKNFIYRKIGDIESSLSDSKTLDLEINPKVEKSGDLEVELEKSRAMIGEEVNINVISDTDYMIFSKLNIQNERVKPNKVGKFKIIVATENGEVKAKNLQVVKNLNFQMKNISFPKNITCGNNGSISLLLENLGEEMPIQLVFNTKEDIIIENKNITLKKDKIKKIQTPVITKNNCMEGERIIHFRIADKYYNQKVRLDKKQDKNNKGKMRGFFKILTNFLNQIRGFFSKSPQP